MSLSYLNYYQLALHKTSSSLLFEIHYATEHTFFNTYKKKISFLNVIEPASYGGFVHWVYNRLDTNVVNKKHRILTSNMGHHSFVDKKVVQIKNTQRNKKVSQIKNTQRNKTMKRDRTEL